MGVELYDRVASLIIAPTSGADGIELGNLRFTFSVEKTSTSEGNKANIKIYNLASQTRDSIQIKDQAVSLEGGYKDLSQRIFAGVIKRFEHKRNGVNIVTELECKDGGQDLEGVEFQKTYGTGTSKTKIIRDVIREMPHTDEGMLSSTAITGSISAKLSMSGSARRCLDRLAKSWNFEWSIQDGAIQVLDELGTTNTQSLALVLSPESGLIGVPVKTDRGAKFKSLMIPSLKPGSYVTVKSEFLSGHYKVDSLKHAGDTHGTEWSTDCEARSLT